jgi:hypothetical protein
VIVIDNFKELNDADKNECTTISFDIDMVENKDFYSFYELCLSKLRINGKLCLSGTSLSMFARFVINAKQEVKQLQETINKAKCFHELTHVESLMRRDLFIENIWFDEERFNIVGVRND